MKLMLRHKIIGLAVISALLPVVVLTLLLSVQDDHIVGRVTRGLDGIVEDYLSQVAKGVYGLCKTAKDLTRQTEPRAETIDALRRAIFEMQDEENGDVIVILGGKKRGESVIAPSGDLRGRNRLEERDADGRDYVREIVEKAETLKGGAVDSIRYRIAVPGVEGPQTRICYFTYFEPWHWVICVEGDERDFYFVRNEAEESLQVLIWETLAAGVGALALALVIAIYLGNKMAGPITHLTEVSRLIASGDLDKAASSMGFSLQEQRTELPLARPGSEDETDKLHGAIRLMIEQLTWLIGQMRNASYKLVSTASQISNASKQQEGSVMTFGSSSSEVAAAVKQISATSQELVKTMQGVREVAGDTANLADAGRNGLGGMESTMRQLERATASISSKLSVMSEKAGNINSVVTTISKVAEQTNLLSLNAAIEAEKAGEYGLGFGVVAREIRRLADQTAAATLDIDQTVREMQSAVSAGVMEMDKFSEEVRRGVEETGSISDQLGQIIEQVQALTPRFESVGEGMESQSKGAQQISMAIQQLSQVAQQSSNSLSDLNRAAGQLQEAVSVLREEISKFKIGTVTESQA